VILGIQQGLKEDGIEISLVKLCQWFGVARRTVYYRQTKGQPKLQEQFVKPIKAMIEENTSFGYRTVVHLFGQKLWAATGVHHALQPGAKRDGRAGDQDTQGAVRTPPPL
jgi:predicted regulator of amino acid metabolism with ACT domain